MMDQLADELLINRGDLGMQRRRKIGLALANEADKRELRHRQACGIGVDDGAVPEVFVFQVIGDRGLALTCRWVEDTPLAQKVRDAARHAREDKGIVGVVLDLAEGDVAETAANGHRNVMLSVYGVVALSARRGMSVRAGVMRKKQEMSMDG